MAGLLGSAVLAVAILAVSPYPVGVFVDDGYYVILAKALATGHGLRYLQVPGEPYGTHFPPGYPVFLSFLWRMAPSFPENVAIFKFANAVLLALAAGLGYLFGVRRLRLSSRLAAAAVLFGAASIPALLLAGMVLSETLFLALLVVTLFVAEGAGENASLARAFVVGLLCGALALVRTLGVVVLPIAALLLWRRRGWRHALVALAGGLLLLGPWQVWASTHPFDQLPDLAGAFGSYGTWIANGFRDIGWKSLRTLPVRNAGVVLDGFRVLLAPLLPLGVKDAFVGVALMAGVAGAWAAARRAPIFLLVLLAYGAVVLTFPFAPLRFVWGIWLLGALLFALGVSAIALWRPSGRAAVIGRWVALAACGIVVAGNLVYNVRGYRGRWWNSIPRQISERAAPLVRWAAERTSTADLLVSDYDGMQYLYTGRRALPAYTFTAAEYVEPLPDSASAEALGRILAYYRPRYLITSAGWVLRVAAQLPAGSGVRLVVVDTTQGGGVILRVERTSGSGAAQGDAGR